MVFDSSVFDDTVFEAELIQHITLGPVLTEDTVVALHFFWAGQEIGPVATEETATAPSVEILVRRTLGPVLTEETVTLLQGDYEILRTLGPVLTEETVNAFNRKTTPVVVRQTPLYPVVFIHSEAWPRQLLAVLTSAHGIDRSHVAMQPGRNGRDTGQAQFGVSAADAQLSPDVLKHGQLLAIESAGMPVWAGPILGIEEDTRGGMIEVSALSIDALLDGRVTRQPERFVKSIGELAVLRTLLDQANARNQTGIIASMRLATGQPVRELQTGGQSLMEALNEMTTRSGSEWWVDVSRTPRKLDATLHLGYRQGLDLSASLHLYEGVHFSGRYKSDLSQVKQSVVVVGDFGQELDERNSVAHYIGAPGVDFGAPLSQGSSERLRRALDAMPAGLHNERVEYELMTGNTRELAAAATRAHERPLGAGEMFQDLFYNNVDWNQVRPGNLWTRHGMHKGQPLVRVSRMVSVQPDEEAGTVLVISEVQV